MYMHILCKHCSAAAVTSSCMPALQASGESASLRHVGG